MESHVQRNMTDVVESKTQNVAGSVEGVPGVTIIPTIRAGAGSVAEARQEAAIGTSSTAEIGLSFQLSRIVGATEEYILKQTEVEGPKVTQFLLKVVVKKDNSRNWEVKRSNVTGNLKLLGELNLETVEEDTHSPIFIKDNPEVSFQDRLKGWTFKSTERRGSKGSPYKVYFHKGDSKPFRSLKKVCSYLLYASKDNILVPIATEMSRLQEVMVDEVAMDATPVMTDTGDEKMVESSRPEVENISADLPEIENAIHREQRLGAVSLQTCCPAQDNILVPVRIEVSTSQEVTVGGDAMDASPVITQTDDEETVENISTSLAEIDDLRRHKKQRLWDAPVATCYPAQDDIFADVTVIKDMSFYGTEQPTIGSLCNSFEDDTNANLPEIENLDFVEQWDKILNPPSDSSLDNFFADSSTDDIFADMSNSDRQFLASLL